MAGSQRSLVAVSKSVEGSVGHKSKSVLSDQPGTWAKFFSLGEWVEKLSDPWSPQSRGTER